VATSKVGNGTGVGVILVGLGVGVGCIVAVAVGTGCVAEFVATTESDVGDGDASCVGRTGVSVACPIITFSSATLPLVTEQLIRKRRLINSPIMIA